MSQMTRSTRETITNSAVFLLSSIATGWQQLYNFMWAIYGSPTSTVQYCGLIGSVALSVAALVLFVRVTAAYVIAVVGVTMIWAYYASAIWATGSLVFDVLTNSPWRLIPAMLLILSTIRILSRLRAKVG
jgi:hypothetical protein